MTLTKLNGLKDLDKLARDIGSIMQAVYSKRKLGRTRLARNTRVVVRRGRVEVLLPEYADFVDEGRKAGKRPPIAPILRWIKRNRIKSDVPPKALAFAVANSIAKKGIKARPFLDDARELVSKRIDGIIKNTKILG
jgi:hypothetical protein